MAAFLPGVAFDAFYLKIKRSYEDRAPAGNFVGHGDGGIVLHLEDKCQASAFHAVSHGESGAFKLKVVHAHEGCPMESADGRKWVYFEGDSDMGYTSSEDEAAVFQAVVNFTEDDWNDHFRLQCIESYEDRCPAGNFVFNEGEGNFGHTSVASEATCFSRKKYKFKVAVVSSYEDRAPEGNTMYNEEGGDMNNSSVGSEGTKFAIVHHEDGFKLKYLKSHEGRVPHDKWVYNEDGGQVNYSSSEDEATVFQRVIVDSDAGHFKIQYVSSYEDRVPEGKWLYNEDGGNFNYSSNEDEATVFKNFNKHDYE